MTKLIAALIAAMFAAGAVYADNHAKKGDKDKPKAEAKKDDKAPAKK